MKVKLLTGRASSRGSDSPGSVIEVDDREGKALIASGQAVAVATRKKLAKVKDD